MKKILAVLLLALSTVLILGCSSAEQATQPEPVAPQTEAVVEEAPAAAPETEVVVEKDSEVVSSEIVAVEKEMTEPEDVQVEAEPKAMPEEVEEIVEVEPAVETESAVEDVEEAQADTPAEDAMEEIAEADESTDTEVVDEEALAEADEADTAEEMEAMPFTAAVGLDTFSAYKLDVDVAFDGTKAGKPTVGNLVGVFETTHGPEAQHWLVQMTGDVLPELAMLGGKVELYDVGGTMYMQNPGDGTWIGVPGFLVQGMMPSEIYSPEDSIELPVTAVLQPGQEEINGIVTQRYTFGANDLASDAENYENVNGTIWVAVEGDYVVKYEAEITGNHSDLTAGDIKLLDEGTITMAYDLTDVNGDFAIGPPAGAKAIDLASLLFQ